jgi:hypothetical protein
MPEVCIVHEWFSASWQRRCSVPLVISDRVTENGKLNAISRVYLIGVEGYIAPFKPVVVKWRRRRWEYVERFNISGELQTHNWRKTHTPYNQAVDIEP